MATAWLSYAWDDNKSNDVDFVAQELVGAGVGIKLDRWNIQAGHRLWEQIEGYIQDPNKSDAWVFYATQNSLGSEPCKEEFAYALDRGLRARGNAFPVIGLFPGSVDIELIPAAIRTRLYVSLTDVEWKERVVAAVEGRNATINRPHVDPFSVVVYTMPNTDGHLAIEVRPRAGQWDPFCSSVPIHEKDLLMWIQQGRSRRIPADGPYIEIGGCSEASKDGNWWTVSEHKACTPSQSFYIYCKQLPSKLVFGEYNGRGYVVTRDFLLSRYSV